MMGRVHADEDEQEAPMSDTATRSSSGRGYESGGPAID
jgi:hypothetical protein